MKDHPEHIKVIHPGKGGTAFLIKGKEKTAVIDCGMAYSGQLLAELIRTELGERPLDYALLSHTHYDHIGGLPYLRQEWPRLQSFGAAHGESVLKRPGALRLIRTLGESAACDYLDPADQTSGKGLIYRDGDLRVDHVICENDTVDLGGGTVVSVLETPGHTKCSLSFFLEKEDVVFPGESIGCVEVYGERMLSSVLTSYSDAAESIIKCRALNAGHIISPHFGWIDDCYVPVYWDWALRGLFENELLICEGILEGLSNDEILTRYADHFRVGYSKEEQPLRAFLINSQNGIRLVAEELELE